ncbi:YlaF family protein [Bacillus sp. SG-1]|uniref:YlaF family protein n=1 Tax=Bacillus sp. SG-1 TaxID=161544 RepID=UPI0001543856|nr:YlaF family protein [Bacillus sp. SG-1]EDL64699.1 YlaF [Bacillus sp. SG-1]
MKNIKWIFVLYAVLSAVCIMGIGIAISEKSLFLAILAVAAWISVMGYGFKTKKKFREEGKL